MRIAVCGVVLAALAQQALAADAPFPILRGTQSYEIAPPAYFRWEGMYAGVQGGYSTESVNFGNSTSSLLNYILRESVLQPLVSTWTTLPKGDTVNGSFGGFVGYNMQWEDVILGVEANYNSTSLQLSASDSLSRLIRNPPGSNPPAGHDYSYDVTVAAKASINITDLATFRGRAGWSAGPFMPYAFAGFAVGRADVSREATVTATRTDNFTVSTVDPATGQIVSVPTSETVTLALPGTQREQQNGAFIYGYAVGLGLDYAITSRFFLRTEWELVKFGAIKDMIVGTNTIRAAAGLRF